MEIKSLHAAKLAAGGSLWLQCEAGGSLGLRLRSRVLWGLGIGVGNKGLGLHWGLTSLCLRLGFMWKCKV